MSDLCVSWWRLLLESRPCRVDRTVVGVRHRSSRETPSMKAPRWIRAVNHLMSKLLNGPDTFCESLLILLVRSLTSRKASSPTFSTRVEVALVSVFDAMERICCFLECGLQAGGVTTCRYQRHAGHSPITPESPAEMRDGGGWTRERIKDSTGRIASHEPQGRPLDNRILTRDSLSAYTGSSPTSGKYNIGRARLFSRRRWGQWRGRQTCCQWT